MKTPVETHVVKEADRKRIICSDCRQRPAMVCHHIEWDTSNTTGISFWYFCQECADTATYPVLAPGTKV